MYNDDEILKKNIENNRYFNFVFRIRTTVAAATTFQFYPSVWL